MNRCECGARLITLVDAKRDDYEIICPRCDDPRRKKDYAVYDEKRKPCLQKTI